MKLLEMTYLKRHLRGNLPIKDRRHRATRLPPDAGVTLLELVVVIAILALLAMLVVPSLFGILSSSKRDTARLQISRLSETLDLYLVDTGQYPTTEQGLNALYQRPNNVKRWNGPYLKGNSNLLDPWGNPYQYRSPGQHGQYDLFSFGADGREGGEGDNADITNWSDGG